jgi:voltage-gated potassium channel
MNLPVIENKVQATKFHSRLIRRLEMFIQVLIVASLVAFSVETLPDLSTTSKLWLERFEQFSILVFVIEYLTRLWFAKNRRAFVFSFFGLVDLFAILPFFLATTIDLRSARALRLLRVFRILKLARYNAAVHRFHVALMLAKEEIILFMILTSIVLYLAAVGIYHFEHEAQPEQFKSVFHSIWWAITTSTTVGYGDVYPITTGGRMFTFLVLFAGLGIVSVPAGLVSAALLRARSMEADEKLGNELPK